MQNNRVVSSLTKLIQAFPKSKKKQAEQKKKQIKPHLSGSGK